ncbi:hypothetical protein ACOMHN_055055 [Nucella lapillus]
MGEPEVLVMGEPEVLVMGEPEVLVMGEPEVLVMGEPEVLVMGEPEIQEAGSHVEEPSVHGVGWESGARLWCYFCQSEIAKHQTRDDCTVACAAFLTHLASQEHSQKMHEFFWDNLIPVNKKKRFIVSGKEINRFMENAEKAVADYLTKEREKFVQEREKIRVAEHRSQEVTWIGRQQEVCVNVMVADCSVSSSATPTTRQQEFSDAGDVPIGKKTVFAFGEGLTCISLSQSKEEGGGNIYTRATPPWLIEDDEENKTGEIGPTADTFAKHLQKLQKQKLPACRVGAGFNRKVDTSAQWLPDFGRVWNSGRRLNSQHQFLKERSARGSTLRSTTHRKATATATSTSTVTKCSQPGPQRDRTSWNRPDGCETSPPITAYEDPSTVTDTSVANGALDTRSEQNKRHTSVWTLGVNGDHGHTTSYLPRSGEGRYDAARHDASCLRDSRAGSHKALRHDAQPSQSPSCSFTDHPPSHRALSSPFNSASANPASAHLPVLDRTLNDRLWSEDSGMCQSLSSLDVKRPPHTDGQDGGVSAGCRPYKRRRVVPDDARSAVNSGLIAITPALLSQPAARTKLAKRS